MIFFSRLKYFGKLGNQMFQYASCLGIARKFGTQFVSNVQDSDLQNGFVLGSSVDIMQTDEKPVALYTERGLDRDASLEYLKYDQNIFSIEDKSMNIEMLGYFQTEKYFKEIKHEIIENFTFKQHIQEKAKQLFKDKGVDPKNSVSLHIRRGDYLKLQHVHPVMDLSYYQKCLEMNQDKSIVVFSDDIEWCKSNIDGSITFFEEDKFTDMCAMSMCSSHIIANSSYSWWAAWLGSGEVFAPRNWFGPKGPTFWDDIYCNGWHIV